MVAILSSCSCTDKLNTCGQKHTIAVLNAFCPSVMKLRYITGLNFVCIQKDNIILIILILIH